MKGFPQQQTSPAPVRRRASRVLITSGLIAALCVSLPSLVAAAGSAIYTAFGDSVAFGALAPIGRGYVPLYAKAFADDNGVFVTRSGLGVPGWTSQDLRDALEGRPLFRLAAFTSKVITWSIGGNDLIAARNLYRAGACGGIDNEDCLKAAVAQLQRNWDAILAALAALRQSRPTVMRTMDIYNPYVSADKASDSWPQGVGDGIDDFTELKPYLDEVNAYIAAASAAQGVPVAQVYIAFNGLGGDEDPFDKGLLAFDRRHPNSRGHALIASLLRDLGYGTVTP